MRDASTMSAWRLLLLAALPALVGVGAGEVIEVGGGWEEGPEFLPTRRSVVAAPGGDAALVCRVAHLGDKAVSWVRAHDLHILAHAGQVFSADPRVLASAVSVGGVVTHTLRLRKLRPADAGRYECQLNTEPKLSQIYNLTVRDDAFQRVDVQALGATTVQAPAGGAATLGCAARAMPPTVDTSPLRIVWYRDGQPLLPQGGRSSGGVSLELERAAGLVTSRLTLAALAPGDAGRYVCRAEPPPDPAGEGWDEGDKNRIEGEVVLTLLVTDDIGVGEMEAMQRDQSPAPGAAAAAAGSGALLAASLLLRRAVH